MAESQNNTFDRPVYIVDGSRTPFLKARGRPGPFPAANLGVACGRPLLDRQNFSPTAFDEVVLGCMIPGPDEANIARVIALRLGCGADVPAWTVQRNCASAMQALDCAAVNIASGRSNLVLAGGVEAMSYAPILHNNIMVNWLADFSQARSPGQKIKALSQLRGKHLAPIIGILRGLTDPVVGLNMGQTAEILAHRFDISREEMDEFSVESHRRLAAAIDNHHLDEIEVTYDNNGKFYEYDDGLRRDSDMKGMKKLKPYFDRNFGKVTPANSAQITDGAAMLILASEDAVKEHDLTVMGQITDTQWSALDPAEMGLGPAHAMAPILNRNKLHVDDVDYWEINEAFAAQVLSCQKAWQDETYCRDTLKLKSAIGSIPHERLNVDGGGISIGHPVGATGARIVLHLLHILKRNKAKKGIASLCIGGGQGGAMLIENEME